MAKSNKIRTPKGFLFSVSEASIKKPGRKDMALIFSEVEATAAGLFTKNRVKGAPVKLNMKHIPSGKGQAIIVNSGNANACTGEQGIRDALVMAELPARMLNIESFRTYVCSTGVIGTPLPMKKVAKGLKEMVQRLGESSLEDVAQAIMTTDTFFKVSSRKITISGKKVTISACAKGAGMISPNMATMLCFIVTDVAIDRKALQSALREAVDPTFNSITIDGDMSTSDTVLIFANGLAGNKPLSANSRDFKSFKKALSDICGDLSRMIVRDGEGATKTIEIKILGARMASHAKKAAEAVANSLLVKTAIHGNDTNWGRIMAAIGYSGIPFQENRVDIYINNLRIAKNGLATGKDSEANKLLKSKNIRITIDLHAGLSSARVLTCDLTEEYVRINSKYRT